MRARLFGALAVMALAAVGLSDARRLSGALRSSGTYHGDMGPDIYLAVVSSALLLCGVWHLTRGRVDSSPRADEGPDHGMRQVRRLVVLLVAYMAAFSSLGYLLATLIFFPVAFFLFGVRPLKSVAIGVLAAAIFYVLFAYFAELPLPKGLLDFGA